MALRRADELMRQYALEQHPEGGAFREAYTAPFTDVEGRPLAGSIYFLLRGAEVSHFHQIDCDEIWYYHEGCGLIITVLTENGRCEALRLGNDIEHGEAPMVVIPKGAIFAAENVDPEGYTFLSCATTPKFHYEGFRLVGQDEIKKGWLDAFERIRHLISD